MSAKSNSRDLKFDITRGLLIILVVLGHSGISVKNYIFWFHMPAFFMLSGFFYRKVPSIDDWKINTKKLFLSLGIPYFSYLLLLNGYQLGIDIVHGDIHSLIQNLYSLIYGGRAVGNQNAVFWFITVLFLTRAFIGLLNIFYSDQIVMYITIVLFFIGTSESLVFHTFNKHPKMPLNADVVLVSSFFYYLGYTVKPYLLKISLGMFLISTLIFAIFAFLSMSQVIDFQVDMKRVLYYNPLFFVILPLASSIVVLYISNKIKNMSYISNGLAYVGMNSLSIMYLHMGINLVFLNYFHWHYGVLMFTILGVCLPLFWEKLVRTNKTTRLLFIGK